MNPKQILRKHLILFCFLFALLFIWKCPSQYLFGIPCPGCGLTRAHISALHLDFKQAMYYHPLFFLALPVILYVIHRHVLKWHFPKKVEYTLGILLILLLFGVYFYRLFISKNPVVQIHLQDGLFFQLKHQLTPFFT